MQAEYGHIRGNGFIISPTETPFPENRGNIQNNQRFTDSLSATKEALSNVVDMCGVYTKKASKTLSKKLLSLGIVACCLAGIFSAFTFSTGIYTESGKIASVKNNSEIFAALAEAKAVATSYGIENFKFSFSTSPVIALRSKVLSGTSLKNRILLGSGAFIEGCSMYINDTKIFDAESLSTAQSAVKEYMSLYAINGKATLSATPQYKTCIIPKASISSQEECIEKLKTSNIISVVSVVNATTVKAVPFETRTEKDSSMFVGESITVTEGTNGNMQIFEETVYKNGEPQSVRISSEKITAKPVNRVVRVGTKNKKVLESGLLYPLKGVLSSPFGARWGNVHEGIDIAVAEGTPVRAAECGTVTRVSENAGGYGKLIQIDHGYGVETIYAHLNEIRVAEGQAVSSSTIIGLSGNTGRSTGPHLHFEIIKGGTPIDPLKYLK